METGYSWWQRGIIYQIVPQSFMDGNGDGIGDLDGICRRLDYLAWLGADAVWLGPVYPSPMIDFGYDVSEYKSIDPRFGTPEDLDRLIARSHACGLRVILDLVPNHSSDQHPWFLEASSSRTNPKRDWYIWQKPGPGGGPPNNWMSVFSGNGWHYDPRTEEYFFHTFAPNEPDLNWSNPQVREAMLDIIRFWLGKGIDGFRLDAPWYLVKDARLRNNPYNPNWTGERKHERLTPTFTENQTQVHEIIQRVRETVDEYPDRLLMGEFYLALEQIVAYYGPGNSELHLPCNYELINQPWEAQAIAETICKYEGARPQGAWPTWALGNHDMPRVASRIGVEHTRAAAMLLLTLYGTPLLYYGDEIRMCNVDEAASKQSDPQVMDYPKGNRAPYRTPMQWSGEAQAGFTAGDPWLPLATDYVENNVEAQRQDPESLLNLYRRLIALRRAEPALHGGRITVLPAEDDVLSYLRDDDRGSRFLVALNLGKEPVAYRSEWVGVTGRIRAATCAGRDGEDVANGVELRPGEGAVIELA